MQPTLFLSKLPGSFVILYFFLFYYVFQFLSSTFTSFLNLQKDHKFLRSVFLVLQVYFYFTLLVSIL